jgi:mannan endo-1,6-alpha-mannosidase
MQGNDDQAFWSLAVMSALEYQFPDPEKAPAAYLDVAINSFNNIVNRWDEDSCGGGLKWQIYPENAYGYNYKNAISNGCAFALGARLARYTGNQTYADWAVKIYDWTKKVGLISDIYEVFDGSDDKTNCEKVGDKTQWTYNNAMFLHGSAFMFDFMKGDSTWKERTEGFLKHAELLFFRPFENATDIMYEWACETGESGRHCNLDQQSFKAYLSRFMAKTALLAPFTKDTITKYLKASAVGAAKSCSGGADGVTCGSKWYTGGWDGASGVGQQLSALEVTQSLLMIKKGTLPVKKGETKPEPSVSATPKPSSSPAATSVPASSSHSAPPPPPASSSSSQAPLPSSQAPPPASSSQAPPPAPSSQGPPPAPSSQAPPPVSSVQPTSSSAAAPSSQAASSASSVAVAPSPPNSSQHMPTEASSSSCTTTSSVPSVIASPSPAPPASVKPSVSTDTHPPVRSSPSVQPDGQSSQNSSSTSCTPSATTTVYVPAVSQTPPPVVLSTTIPSVAPPASSANSTVPLPSQPLEFIGAAVNIKVSIASILAAAAMAMVAGLV